MNNNYYIGQTIDDYTIIDMEIGEGNNKYYSMVCNVCGHIKKVRLSHINEYLIKYPKAFYHNPKKCYPIQERYTIGTSFGDYTLVNYVKDNRGETNLLCKCKICGVEKIYTPVYLKSKNYEIFHNQSCNRQSYDGLAQKHPRLYNIWYAMVYRCTNQKSNSYYLYGGRGITTEYLIELRGFNGFIEDMADSYYNHINYLMSLGYSEEYAIKNTTIDRIDNNDGYYKYNLRWATAQEQTQNRRCVRIFIAIDTLNNIYLSNNQSRFAENHNLNSSCISRCLAKRQDNHFGWVFYYIDDISLYNQYCLFTPMNMIYEMY